MENELLEEFYRRFSAYGVITSFDVKNNTTDYDFPSGSVSVLMGQHITMSVSFYGHRSIERLGQDLKKIAELDYEEHLRNQIPTLKRAYEEYQLLLKLMK